MSSESAVSLVCRKVLIPVDGSEPSVHAARQGFGIAESLGARSRFLHVLDIRLLTAAVPLYPMELGPEHEERMRRDGEKGTLTRLVSAGIPEDVEVRAAWGVPAATILDEAKTWGAQLIIMGTHGRTGLKRAFLGSQTERVLRSSGVPVLVVPMVSGNARS